MGRVFLAEDPLIDRQVAIKVMAAEGDDEARERFRNEARSAGQLSHPNIVQLYEFGFHQGQPYLVMEYLVGKSLDRWLARPRHLEAKLSILLDLCQAVGHAHSRGVLHRDIKPSNLQVLPDGTCKLMDFGIARSRAVQLTATGTILGTPEFIAPEVLQDAGYSNRSDLFAVGLVTYQVLAGANPFRASSLEGCLMRILTYEPPSLASVSSEVPEELSDVVSKYIYKAPKERPADVLPLIAALRKLQDRTLRLDSAPPLAAAPTVPISPAREVTEGPTIHGLSRSAARGRRLPTGAALLVVFAVIVVAAAMSWRLGSGPEPAPEITARPPTASAGGSPAADTRPAEDGTGTGHPDRPPASLSSPAPASRGTLADSSSLRGRTQADPGPEAAESTRPEGRDRTERPATQPPASAVAALESGPSSPPEEGAAESATLPATTGSAAAEIAPGEGGPTASHSTDLSTPVEASTLTLPPAEAPAGGASPDEHAGGPTGDQSSTPELTIDRLEPMVVRRGSTAAVQIIGDGFGPDTTVAIRRGGRPVRALRVLRTQTHGASRLRVTLLVDRQLPLGTYSLTVIDTGGRESNPITLEVGL